MNQLQGIDKIYWINLDRSADRRQSMETLLHDDAFQGISIERISAVDGQIADTVYSQLNLEKKKVTDYEYACLLSHLNTLRRFSETNDGIALILEDDVTLELKPYWKQTVREIIDNAPADWEILPLSYITIGYNNKNAPLYDKNINNKYFGTAAYLINRGAAKKLIQKYYVDGKYKLGPGDNHEADMFLYSKCKTYVYKYPYFIYKTENTSLIHPNHLHDHERSKRKIMEMYTP